MTKPLATLLIGLITCLTASSQRYKEMMQDPSYNFYEVVEEAERYFEDHPKGKGSGFTPYQRWKHEHEPHYYPSGIRDQTSGLFAQRAYERFLAKNPKSSARSGTNPWTELGPWKIENITGHYAPGMGRIESFYIDRQNFNRMFLGSRSGGFWRTYDGGVNWENTTDHLPASGVNSITVSPHDSNLVLINVRNSSNGRTQGVYMSKDDGASWGATEFSPKNGIGGLGENLQVIKVDFHPTIQNMVMVTTDHGIYRSTDTLNTWTQITTSATYDFVFHPTNDSVMYAWEYWAHNKLSISTDLGMSFSYTDTLVGITSRGVRLAVSPACPDCIYAGNSNGIWISSNRGTNFSFLASPGGGGNHFMVNDLNTLYMISGGVDIYRSTDGGNSFNQATWWSLGSTSFDGGQYIHADPRETACYDGIFYVATDGYLARSTDNGASWEILSETIGIRENYSLGQSQSHRKVSYCGSQDNGQSLVNDTAWLEIYGADGMEGVIQPLNPDIFMGSWQYGGRRRSFDGGLSGQVCTPFNQDDGLWIAPLLLDPVHQMRVYSMDETVFASDDFGGDWDDLGKPFGSESINQAVIGESNPDYMMFSDGGDLVKTTNGGQNYQALTFPVNHFISDIALAPKNDSIVAVVNNSWQRNGEKVYISKDFGETWENQTYNLEDMPIRSVIIDHSEDMNIFLGAEIGVYYKALSDTIWTLYTEDLPTVSLRDMKIHRGSNTLRAASWGRGLFEVKLPGREDDPSIEKVYMTKANTLSHPKFGVDNYIYADVAYGGTLSSVNLSWSQDHLNLDTTEAMVQHTWNTYRSARPMPNLPEGSDLHFRITATGDHGDESESYRFMYTVKPFEYCEASGSSGTGADYIDYVEMVGIGNTSDQEGYADFTNVQFPISRNTAYELRIDLNFHWDSDTTAAWIDFNQDTDFTPEEMIVMGELDSRHESYGIFQVPADAKLGETRMRVRSQYWNESPIPCDERTGEVEDYTVLISNRVGQMEANEVKTVKLIPNPAENSFRIICCEEGLESVVLKDLQGRVARSWIRSQEQYSLDGLAAGVYSVTVEAAGQVSTSKLLVK